MALPEADPFPHHLPPSRARAADRSSSRWSFWRRSGIAAPARYTKPDGLVQISENASRIAIDTRRCRADAGARIVDPIVVECPVAVARPAA